MRIATCWNCGQTLADDSRDDERHLLVETHGTLCDGCRESLYGGGECHETQRLFKPAPRQTPGQLGLGF